MNGVTDDRRMYGRRLWDFILDECRRQGMAPTGWTRRHHISDATALRWREGVEPSMKSLQQVARASGKTTWQLLLVCGYVDNEDLAEGSGTVLDALRTDRTIPEGLREALRQVHDLGVLSASVREQQARERERELAAAS